MKKSVYAKKHTRFLYYKLFEIIFAAIKYRHVKIFAAHRMRILHGWYKSKTSNPYPQSGFENRLSYHILSLLNLLSEATMFFVRPFCAVYDRSYAVLLFYPVAEVCKVICGFVIVRWQKSVKSSQSYLHCRDKPALRSSPTAFMKCSACLVPSVSEAPAHDMHH